MSPLSDNSSFIPSLVFFETTSACDYACRHCRAEAQELPSPDQLTTSEAMDVIDQIGKLSSPAPEIIFTGGNTLLREDIRELILHSNSMGIPFSVSPSGSSALTEEMMVFLKDHNSGAISLSIDGTATGTHDWLRKKDGSFESTIELIRKAKASGLEVQINTTVMKRNILELPEIARMVVEEGIRTWEVFFLINTGRGASIEDVSPSEYMQINNWLADLSQYGITVRTVEGPVQRVISAMRKTSPDALFGPLYERLKSLSSVIPVTQAQIPGSVSRLKNGKKPFRFRGTLFIGNNGTVSPSGLFNLPIGNIRSQPLNDILAENRTILDFRNSGKLEGKCGICNFMKICGGSRARALYKTGNPLAEDPDCLYIPETIEEEAN